LNVVADAVMGAIRLKGARPGRAFDEQHAMGAAVKAALR
jgi:hypothetical protein